MHDKRSADFFQCWCSITGEKNVQVINSSVLYIMFKKSPNHKRLIEKIKSQQQ